ncbi:MAG: PAS domain-containing sensor histidine kinase [Rhizomicrobium sp.]
MDLAWTASRTVARETRPGLAGALLAFSLGAVMAAAALRAPAGEAIAGLVVFALLGGAVYFLTRLAERSDERLLTAESSYRAFFEHALEGIFRTTPDGRYIDANPALARIYGYGSVAALKAGLTNIADQLYVDPSRRAQFQALMHADDQVSAFESEIRRRDGATIWISENARAVRDWTGRIVCYEGTVEDVTARYAAQRALRKALAEAEEASRAKSAFLAAMSHELKTPLNAVLGFSEIIKDEVLGPIQPRRYRAYASDIHASGTRLLAIISDVLDVARLSGGAITLNARPCAVAALAEEAVALARIATEDRREVAIEIAAGLPQVDADPQRLRQSLANLLSNALKFTPEGGRIVLKAWQDAGGGICLAVRDTGIGMDRGKIAAALEPFRQLDGSLARRFEGAGLGLAITKSLVELHGGTLAIESAVGAGTTVTIALPPARTLTLALAS